MTGSTAPRTPGGARRIALACAGLLLALAAPGASGMAPVTTVRTESGAVEIILSVDPAGARVVRPSGEPARLELPGLGSVSFGGDLLLPAHTVWVGVPVEGEIDSRVEIRERAPLSLDPAARSGLPLDGLPQQPIEVGPARWLRNQRVVPITFEPLVRGSAGPEWARAVRVRLSWTEGDVTGRPGRPGEAPEWEATYRATLVNYEQARVWRRARPAATRARPAGTRSFSDSPEWVRIDVPRHGLYAVTGTALQAAGIDLASIPAAEVRLFTGLLVSLPERVPYDQLDPWLREVAIRPEGLEDGSFDPQDRILFYGLGPDGFYSDFARPNTLFERYRTDEFSNVNCYWLGWGSFPDPARRWGVVDGTVVPQPARTSAPFRIHFEENRIWDPHPWEPSVIQNPDSVVAWEKWHWFELIATASNIRARVNFVTPDPAPGGSARLAARFWGANRPQRSQIYPDHVVHLDLGGDTIGTAGWQERNHADVIAEGIPLAGSQQQLGLLAPYLPDTTAARNDRSYLAWFEVDYERELIAHGDSLEFLVEPGLAPLGFEAQGIVEPSRLLVLDVTDPLLTTAITPAFEGDPPAARALFSVEPDPSAQRRIILADRSRARSPRLVRDTPPAGGYLRERGDPVDYIVIAHASMLAQAQRLADWRSEHGPQGGPGLRVAVVDVQDIYDEFSAGRLDPAAIRNFLHFALDVWNGGDPAQAPSYAVLLGDALYDFRNRKGESAVLTVPTYEGYYDPALLRSVYSPQFGSDDWLVLFDEAPDPSPDMFMGRLVADTPAAAEALVDKVISYESSQDEGSWRQRFTLVADDICQGLNPDDLGVTHMRQTEELADLVLPPELERDRIFLYEFGTECLYDRKPDAAAALRASIDRGTLVVNFTGHGSEEQLADERVLETPGVAGMGNADRLFFFLTASCSVGKFDFAGEGLGEALVRQPSGGAIAVFSATAVAFSGTNAALNQAFFRSAFPNDDVLGGVPLGAVAVAAKLQMPRPWDLGNRRYPLLGEPVVRLSLPGYRAALSVEAERVGQPAAPDTILRGAPLWIRGEVRDSLGVREDFQGSVELRVYDSERVRRATKDLTTVVYNLTGATIFRGNAAVTNGRFATRIMVPAVLRTGERGAAQVYAFAVAEGGASAIGGVDDLVVPEIPPPLNPDQEGPAIVLTPDGDPERLPEGSLWEATLTDSSGINITQLVPSRSVLIRVEEGARLVHIEDLAASVSFPETYQVGRLSFRLPETLIPGVRYRLTLEASDNLDHRSSLAREFTLVGSSEEKFDLARVFNVPNPLEDRGTTFFVEMNQAAEVVIRIFTIGGARIREIRAGTVTPEEGQNQGIAWDGRDEDGDRLANGVYFYKVTARTNAGGNENRIERLAVLR